MIGRRHVRVIEDDRVDEPKVRETVVVDLPALIVAPEAFLLEAVGGADPRRSSSSVVQILLEAQRAATAVSALSAPRCS